MYTCGSLHRFTLEASERIFNENTAKINIQSGYVPFTSLVLSPSFSVHLLARSIAYCIYAMPYTRKIDNTTLLMDFYIIYEACSFSFGRKNRFTAQNIYIGAKQKIEPSTGYENGFHFNEIYIFSILFSKRVRADSGKEQIEIPE